MALLILEQKKAEKQKILRFSRNNKVAIIELSRPAGTTFAELGLQNNLFVIDNDSTNKDGNLSLGNEVRRKT